MTASFFHSLHTFPGTSCILFLLVLVFSCIFACFCCTWKYGYHYQCSCWQERLVYETTYDAVSEMFNLHSVMSVFLVDKSGFCVIESLWCWWTVFSNVIDKLVTNWVDFWGMLQCNCSKALFTTFDKMDVGPHFSVYSRGMPISPKHLCPFVNEVKPETAKCCNAVFVMNFLLYGLRCVHFECLSMDDGFVLITRALHT